MGKAMMTGRIGLVKTGASESYRITIAIKGVLMGGCINA